MLLWSFSWLGRGIEVTSQNSNYVFSEPDEKETPCIAKHIQMLSALLRAITLLVGDENVRLILGMEKVRMFLSTTSSRLCAGREFFVSLLLAKRRRQILSPGEKSRRSRWEKGRGRMPATTNCFMTLYSGEKKKLVLLFHIFLVHVELFTRYVSLSPWSKS